MGDKHRHNMRADCGKKRPCYALKSAVRKALWCAPCARVGSVSIRTGALAAAVTKQRVCPVCATPKDKLRRTEVVDACLACIAKCRRHRQDSRQDSKDIACTMCTKLYVCLL